MQIISTLSFQYLFLFVSFTSLISLTYSNNDDHNIFINCGSSQTTTNIHGRKWTGDFNSGFISIQEQKKTTIFTNPHPLIPFSTSRISPSEFSYSFPVAPGPKFIRLHFYPSSCPPKFQRSIFSVKSGPFLLLTNFTPSINSAPISKEFVVNVGEDQKTLNLTFFPVASFAFINGIEVVSIPENLYYPEKNNPGVEFIGQKNPLRVERTVALETIARLNVGGREIQPGNDAGDMFRRWTSDDDFFNRPAVISLPSNTTIDLSFSAVPNYSAPGEVYRTARTMGSFREVNKRQNLTWEVSVDSGFMYFLRLHFCEFQGEISEPYDRMFYIYVADQVANLHADVIQWAGGRGVPVYRDYAVLVGKEEEGNKFNDNKKRNLSISLHTAKDWQTRYSDVILNGIELFKLSNMGNLSGSVHDPVSSTPTMMRFSRCWVFPGWVVVGVLAIVVVALWLTIRRRYSALREEKEQKYTLARFSKSSF